MIALFLCLLTACSDRTPVVVAYCAQDQTYAEPIFAAFEKDTGIKVRAVYDSEAVKTVGLANRLLAERSRPQCDVFWGNEELRTRQLAAAGIFAPTNGWAAFGFRSRRIVINTNRLALAGAPKSLAELTNSLWRSRVALAYPQFGTTATHFQALRRYWGPAAWSQWCRALAANQPLLLDGNSVVVKTVARGDAVVGLTDSDDILAGQREGLPVAALPIDSETLLIPNTVAVIRDAPHPDAAKRLYEYLQSPPVAEQLAAAGALESATPHSNQSAIRNPQSAIGMVPDWDGVLTDLEVATGELSRIFLR